MNSKTKIIIYKVQQFVNYKSILTQFTLKFTNTRISCNVGLILRCSGYLFYTEYPLFYNILYKTGIILQLLRANYTKSTIVYNQLVSNLPLLTIVFTNVLSYTN